MRITITLLLLLLCSSLLCHGQISIIQIIPVTVNPSGTCGSAFIFNFNSTNGNLWGCLGGVWTLITGGGGGAGPPTGAAAGDLGGSYPNPTVRGINGTLLSSLSTGIAKITTGTGAVTIAVAGDFPTLNQSTTGNAATATALAATPSLCPGGQYPSGIIANGNATGCTVAVGSGTVTHSAGALALGQMVVGNAAADLKVLNLTLGDYVYSGASGVITALGQPGNGTWCTSFSSSVPSWVACGSAWSSLTNPTGNLALSMGNNTTVFTSGSSTGAIDPWIFTDSASNTGTGTLVEIETAVGSTMIPFAVTAQNGTDGVQVDATGTMTPIGSGNLNANNVIGAITIPGTSVSYTVQGAGAPVAGTCTGLAVKYYFDTTNLQWYGCAVASTTWNKILSTPNTGTFVLTGLQGSLPAVPPTGDSLMFFSSSGNFPLQSENHAGVLMSMVDTTAGAQCSGGAPVMSGISVTGEPVCVAGGASPGGATNSVQYNNAGALGGVINTTGTTQYLSQVSSGVPAWNTTIGVGNLATSVTTGSFGVSIDGGGATIVAGTKARIPKMPYAGTIVAWRVVSDQTGSIIVDVKRSTYTGFPTTASIAGSDLPTLTTARKADDTTLTGWGSTAIAAGDVIEFVVNGTPTSVQHVDLELIINKS